MDEKHPSYASQVNTTLSLPLSSSWTKASATLPSIPKSAPCQNQPITWFDASISSFYEWGGSAINTTAANNLIWKFTTDGSGGGAWSEVIPTNIVAFNNAARPHLSAFTMQRGVGYALAESPEETPKPRQSPASLSQGGYGTSMDYWWSSGCRDAGRVVVGTIEMVSWDTVSFVDPSTGKWYSQATTGPRPTKKQKFCSVGLQGPNGTYEIFIYGGMSDPVKTLDEIHVLSLLGFVFKSPNSSTPQNDHACALVGSLNKTDNKKRKRQMLSVGGSHGDLGWPKSELDPDPGNRSQYDADANPYDTPKTAKDWYAQGGLDTVSWTSEEVKTMFRSGANMAANPGNGLSDIPGSGGGSSPNNPSEAPNNTTSQAGAIAGGTVGGVAAIALTTALAVLLRRRRARRAQTPLPQPEAWSKSELPAGSALQQPRSEPMNPRRHQGMHPAELYSNHGHSELGPASQQELPG
ncbi:Kelch repeat-containing protein [Apiospora phragmitis]|uniref:Kelch repeat-containing protein n=1 Tax=Apiospora phragmitis TaxID=2905665 RepID=A0ABR1T654_9PEZI